jgi:hypothetical protein
LAADRDAVKAKLERRKKRLAKYIAEKYQPARRLRDIESIDVADVLSIHLDCGDRQTEREEPVPLRRPRPMPRRAGHSLISTEAFSIASHKDAARLKNGNRRPHCRLGYSATCIDGCAAVSS